jgi:hypothetical protein
MRKAIIAVATASLLIPAVAEARAAYPATPPAAARCSPDDTTVRDYRRYVSAVYRRDGVSRRARARLRRLERQACTRRRGAWMERWRARRARERSTRQRAASSWCSPSPHAAGAGCWVIPAWCVRAESDGSWHVSNHEGSGAIGPYQLLGHGAPWPVRARWQALEHHRIARGLYAARGLQPWVACS